MRARPAFNLVALLSSTGIAAAILRCNAGQMIFSVGDAADSVMYVLKGSVKLSVVSQLGREAVVTIVRAGDFFGEACLAGQLTRARTATAMAQSAIVLIERVDMVRLLHTQSALSDRFIEQILLKNIWLEADLLDQIVSPCEQRLARTLLSLARYGKRYRRPRKIVPMMSQSILAGMVGSTRSRINYFMKKFERLGFIETDGGLTVNRSLLRVTQENAHDR